jgi:phosphohistidine swiveling domain-containing protein
MTYEDIYKKAKVIVGEENIVDCRPAVIGDEDQVVYAVAHNAITIWLKNGDVIIYRVRD